jgi:hypothetical protein
VHGVAALSRRQSLAQCLGGRVDVELRDPARRQVVEESRLLREVALDDHRHAASQQVVHDVRHQFEDRAAEPLGLRAFGDSQRAAEYLLVRVLLDERQPELVGKPARERRLARPGRAGHDDECGNPLMRPPVHPPSLRPCSSGF